MGGVGHLQVTPRDTKRLFSGLEFTVSRAAAVLCRFQSWYIRGNHTAASTKGNYALAYMVWAGSALVEARRVQSGDQTP